MTTVKINRKWINSLIRRNPANPDSTRAPRGQWMEPAVAVRALVEAGHSVSGAVRIVLLELGMPVNPRTFAGLRGAYYALLRSD